MQCIVDNLTESEEKRLQLILQIQKLYQDSIPISEIVRITGKDPNTVRKYILGDPSNLCRSNRHGKLEGYQDYIIKCIQEGMNQSEIAKSLAALGYQGSSTNARTYVCNLAKRHHLKLRRYQYTAPRSDEKNIKKPDADYITRKGIFNYIWMGGELSRAHHEYLWNSYPVLQELESCTRQFREFFEKKNMPFLYIFIARYSRSVIKELANFSKGLQRDIEAVENAVASPLSNGFVEGTNSKVKTIKKAMYGRCGITLLSAKLMYQSRNSTNK